MNRREKMGIGKLKVVIAMLLFGSIGLMVKNIELTSSEIALYRGVLGSLFLLIFSLFKKKKISIAVLKSNAVPLLVSGAAIGLNWILLFEAYNYTTIANATLSYYFAPVIVMIVSPFLLKEKLLPSKVVSILVAMSGMFLIVGTGAQTTETYNHTVGIVHTGLAYVLYFSAMQTLKSQTVALLSYIDPVSAVILSALFLGEAMNGVQIIGGVLILGSTVIGGLKWPKKETAVIKEK